VPEWITIGDPCDERLDHYRHLTDADARRAHEAAHGVFVAEGSTVIRRLLQSDYRIRSLLLLPARARELVTALDGVDAEVFIADRAVMADIAGFNVHRGALAIAERQAPRDPAAVLADARVVAVLEGLNDLENLGAIARSASALGVHALLLDPTCADPLHRRCVRVSMGEILFLLWTRLEPWPGALARLPAAGFTLIALTPAAGATRLDDVLRAVTGPVALLLGAEGPGLSAGALAAANHVARIPLRTGVDSLNVGHAAAIAFFAAMR
jgi:tRNA G18 (ribose-2'-O)-methylase SpoU